MKKLIIFLTILISTIFSNVAFADIAIPYEEECVFSVENPDYDKCMKNCSHPDKWFCNKYQCSYEKCLLKNKELYKIYIWGFLLFGTY